MMRILMFGWEYSPRITGGLGSAFYWLAQALTEKGINIDLVIPYFKDPQKEQQGFIDMEEASSLKSRMDSLYEVLSRHTRKISIPSNLSPYPDTPKTIAEEKQDKQTVENLLRKELERFNQATFNALKGLKYDLIHAHDWPTYEAALLAQDVSHKPLVLHVHSTEVDRNGEKGNDFIFNLEKDGFKEADKIITVSRHTKNVLVNHYDVKPEKIEVVYHGIPPGFENSKIEKALPEFKEKIVTFSGRITHQKGPSYFVHAASKIAERSNKVRFIMAGDGDLRDDMIELTAGLGISRRFHFPGHLDKEALKHLWKITDVLVIPSVSEPFGLTGVEAMSADLPVIVSRQSGLTELFPHILQVDYWETDALADLILKVITNPELILRQKQLNSNPLARLSWESAADQVVDLYQSLTPNSVK